MQQLISVLREQLEIITTVCHGHRRAAVVTSRLLRTHAICIQLHLSLVAV
jgi:hypothetical protein